MPDVLLEKITIIQSYIDYLQKYTGRHISLPSADLTALAQMMDVRGYSKKAPLLHIGEKEQYLYFVVKGLVRKYFIRGKEEIITQLAKEGDMISSTVSFFASQDSPHILSPYALDAIEATTVYALPKAKLEQLYRYSHKLNKFARLILTEHILQKEAWELSQLKYNIRERFLQFIENNSELFQRVPQKYQASYLNIKPETFSRLKAQLSRKGKAKTIATDKNLSYGKNHRS